MCSYNRINGTYASEHRELLTDILRDEWGFDGFVVSDWAAVHDRPAALAAGLDLEMPGPRPRRVQAVVDAVATGASTLPTWTGRSCGSFGSFARPRRPRRAARSMRPPTTPWPGASPRTGWSCSRTRRPAAVADRPDRGHRAGGPGAAHPGRRQLADDADQRRHPAPMRSSALAGDAAITYAEGYDESGGRRPDLIAEAVDLAREADVAILFVALPPSKEHEGSDRTDLDLAPQQVALITAVAQVQPRTVVVLFSGSAVVMSAWIDRVPRGPRGLVRRAGRRRGDRGHPVRGRQPLRQARRDVPAPARGHAGVPELSGRGRHGPLRRGPVHRLSLVRRSANAGPVPVRSWAVVHDVRVRERSGVRVHARRGSRRHRAGRRHEHRLARRERSGPGLRPRSRGVRAATREGAARLRQGPPEPGETKTVAIALDARAFAFWDPRCTRGSSEPGEFEILVGSSSADIRERLSVTAVDARSAHPTLNDMSPLRDWLTNQDARVPTIGLLRELAPIIGGVFGEAADDPDALDPHFHSYFGTMPIRGVLEFAAPAGGPDPDARLAQLEGAVRSNGEARTHASGPPDR